MARIQIQDPKVAQHIYDTYMRAFNLDLPLWKQYYYFWSRCSTATWEQASCSSPPL